ncbi:MAG TPA: SPFH domain-containing protein [Methanosarcina sp.]|nr:SPFH domain-containing protein [Methanosarcina sp.]
MGDLLNLIGMLAIPILIIGFVVLIPIWFRRVVPTNEVHIVQSSKKTVSFGKGMNTGNTYYAWPSWIPVIGVTTSKFTLSVFSIDLENYEAYDSGRLPFMVDIKAFFRIADSSMAAERVQTFEQLKGQLQSILQGAVRSILAKNDLESILSERGTFGQQFTAEVQGQLKQWGCETVKNIEFMDIRDSRNSEVIANIMAKKKSVIEMESRMEVAKNHKEAQIAEIEANREAELQRQQAEEAVGKRTAEKQQQVGIATEKAQQEIKAQAKVTAEREMEVQQVTQVRAANIAKEVAVVEAEQDRQVAVVAAEAKKQVQVVEAEGQKQSTVTVAQGNLEQAKLNAQGIEAEGRAKGVAETAILQAPVDTQIMLAKEIGENEGYQSYLIRVRQVEKDEKVGVEQAKALQAAGIKVIANSGDVQSGVTNVMDIFSAKGGLSAGAALEAFANTDAGGAFLKRFGISVEDAKAMLGEDAAPASGKKTRKGTDE